MTHAELITSLAGTVRQSGAVVALDHLRAARATLAGPDGEPIAYHETMATFYVWAVERLTEAGLNDVQLLWHPLVDPASTLAWWDRETLLSAAAATHFVPSTLALPGEPAPRALGLLAAA